MKAFFAIFLAQFRIFYRNPLDFFVTLVLPLALSIVFGFIWGGGERPARVGLVVAGQEDFFISALSGFSDLAWEIYPHEEALEEAVAKRNMDFGLVWDGKNLTVLLDRSRIWDNPEFEVKARRLARALGFLLAGVSPPVYAEKIHVGRLSAPTWYHYIVPGLMAVAILQAGVFAVAGRIAVMREIGVLRRMLVTPLPGWAVLSGVGLLRMLMGFLSAGLTFFVAKALFGVTFSVEPAALSFYALACGLGAMGLGAVVSALARRPAGAAALGNVLVQAMVFLSGIYIPFEFLPAGLKAVGRVLPAYHLAQGMRAALGLSEGGTTTFLANLGFAIFGLAAFFLFGRLTLRPE